MGAGWAMREGQGGGLGVGAGQLRHVQNAIFLV